MAMELFRLPCGGHAGVAASCSAVCYESECAKCAKDCAGGITDLSTDDPREAQNLNSRLTPAFSKFPERIVALLLARYC